MLNQNTVKNPGIEFLTVLEMGINKFGYLNSSLYFYFVTNLRKKIMALVLLQLNLTFPHTSQYALSKITPLPPSPSAHTLWMTP